MGEGCQFHGTCQGLLRECEQLRENDRTLMIETGDIKERVALVEASSKSAHHRLDDMTEQTKAIIRMSVSVENMSVQMQEMVTLYKSQDERLDKLEKAPADAVFAYWKMFVGALVTGVAGVILGLVLKGVI